MQSHNIAMGNERGQRQESSRNGAKGAHWLATLPKKRSRTAGKVSRRMLTTPKRKTQPPLK
eukprot:169474-Rhodomonas_salina.1